MQYRTEINWFVSTIRKNDTIAEIKEQVNIILETGDMLHPSGENDWVSFGQDD